MSGQSVLPQLLRSRRFVPLFVTQLFGAFNDNLFKNAAVLLILFRIGESGDGDARVLVTLAAGLFILPYILVSATAGQLADRFDKAVLMRFIKAAEIPVMAVASFGFVTADVNLCLAALFLMGAQSAFFSPCKYGFLPDALKPGELLGANALIEASTFLVILAGTIAAGLIMIGKGGPEIAAIAIVCLAGIGFIASLFVPKVGARAPDMKLNLNPISETRDVLRHARSRRDIWLTILGISWFWFLGTTLVTQIPTFAKDLLAGDEGVVTLLLTAFSLGIGAGAMLCHRLLKGEISLKHVPLAALGMAAFTVALAVLGARVVPSQEASGMTAFLADSNGWLLLGSLFGLSVAAGLYIVPLNAFLQHRAEEQHRSRTIAADNIMNAGAMVASAGLVTLLFWLGADIADVFLAAAAMSLVAALIVCRLLPDDLVKGLLAGLLRLLYRVDTKGLDHAKELEGPAIFVANHVSFLDGLLLAAFLPGRPMFAIAPSQANRWWVKPFLALGSWLPLESESPFAAKALIREVEKGRSLVIFPEGRLTRTGALMKIYDGPGMIADKTGAPIVPVRIDGAQLTRFSRLKGKLRRHRLPRITLTVLPSRLCQAPEELRGRARRKAIAQQLYDIMSEMMFETSRRPRTLFEALLDARATHGGRTLIIEDPERKPLSYDDLIRRALVLGRKLDRHLVGEATVGVLLPNAKGAAVTFFALQASGRVPALLNFTAGAATILDSCQAAGVATVLTSRRFLEQARLEALVPELAKQVRLRYLEDLRDEIGSLDRLAGWASRPFARHLHTAREIEPEETAVVLFTSGSEGRPKGVALSHDNLLSNCRQVAARIDFTAADRVFDALPLFHAFGLTGGFLLPVLNGVQTFLYPSPLHYRIVPELVYDTASTMLFGTDTFLAGYARKANPYDFYSLRYVFAGAERLSPETQAIWAEKFGLRILEGYGATECAPVIALNTPMHFKPGTVGRFLPGIAHRLEPVPGITQGGRLWVRGPNVMRGYYKAENPGVLQPPRDGWYDTGDIVTIDEAGFITIVGRLKRFAKIAGEMISLTAVEDVAHEIWHDYRHAVVSLPDARKGEQLVLLSDHANPSRDAYTDAARSRGLSDLLVPRHVLAVDGIPLLGSGKTDYVAAKALAERLLAGDRAA